MTDTLKYDIVRLYTDESRLTSSTVTAYDTFEGNNIHRINGSCLCIDLDSSKIIRKSSIVLKNENWDDDEYCKAIETYLRKIGYSITFSHEEVQTIADSLLDANYFIEKLGDEGAILLQDLNLFFDEWLKHKERCKENGKEVIDRVDFVDVGLRHVLVEVAKIMGYDAVQFSDHYEVHKSNEERFDWI